MLAPIAVENFETWRLFHDGSAVRLPGIVHVAVAVNDHVAVNVNVNRRG
jgi:hypothetical protein